MVRIRSGWLVALVALGLGATACKKNDDKKAGTADKTTAAGGGATGTAGGAALTGQAGSDLALLPLHSDAVIGLNFSQLRASALWKAEVEPKLASSNVAGIQKFKDLCGFDPLASLQSVAVGVENAAQPNQSVVIVVHGYDKAKAASCFDKNGVAEVEKDGAKVTVDGDVVMIADGDKHLGFTFVNDSTAIAVLGPDAETKDGIKKVAAGGTGLNTSPTVVGLFGKMKTADSLWLLVNGKATFMKQLGSLGVNPKAIYGSLNVTDGLSLDLDLEFNTPDEASNLVTLAKGELDQAKQFFDKMEVTNNGTDAKFEIALSKQKLEQVASLLGPMLMSAMSSGMGGMGGGVGGP